MKNVFYVLLGIALVILTSATTVRVITVKPATPKYFVVKEFTDADIGDVQAEYIKKMIKKGWILKSQSLAGKQYTIYGIVVMEKY
jgi:hypothetical protein